MFRKLCGRDALDKVVLLTTFWDDIEAEEGPRREREFRESFWRSMIQNQSQVARFERSFESAWSAVDLLLDRDRRHASKDPVDEGKAVPEAQPGTALMETLDKLMAQQQVAMKKLMEERRKDSDPRRIRELEQEVTNLEKKIEVAVAKMQSLKLPLPKRMKRFTRRLFGGFWS